jgi:hypothetical protein
VTFRCSTDNCFAEYIVSSSSPGYWEAAGYGDGDGYGYSGIADIALIDGCDPSLVGIIGGGSPVVIIVIVVLGICCLLGIGALVAKKTKSVPAPTPAPTPVPKSSYSGTNTQALSAPPAHLLVPMSVATPAQTSGNTSLQAPGGPGLEDMKMPELRKLAESSGITKDTIEVRLLAKSNV